MLNYGGFSVDEYSKTTNQTDPGLTNPSAGEQAASGIQNPSQNKYPKFDTGGNNFATEKVFENAQPDPVFSVQGSVNEPTVNTPVIQASATLDTPPTEIRYASLKRRYFASLIDGLIVGAVSVTLNLPNYIGQFKNIIATYNVSDPSLYQEKLETPLGGASNPLYLILSIVAFLFGIVYPIYFIGKKGATPGKKFMKIKVIDKEKKEVPGFLKAFLRETIGKFISAIVLGMGYFWAIRDKEKQTWHDKIAGTIVIADKL